MVTVSSSGVMGRVSVLLVAIIGVVALAAVNSTSTAHAQTPDQRAESPADWILREFRDLIGDVQPSLSEDGTVAVLSVPLDHPRIQEIRRRAGQLTAIKISDNFSCEKSATSSLIAFMTSASEITNCGANKSVWGSATVGNGYGSWTVSWHNAFSGNWSFATSGGICITSCFELMHGNPPSSLYYAHKVQHDRVTSISGFDAWCGS